jgi:hypothetical protein
MRKSIWMAVIAVAFTAGVMAGDGIPMGNAVFYPSVEFVYTHTDNLFLQDGSMPYGNESDTFWAIRPRLGFEFPFKESYMRLDLGYQYKDYNDYTLTSHDTWLADFTSNFKFSNNAVLKVDARYFRGVQEVLEFDPGYERYFANDPFDRWEFLVGVDFNLNKHNTLGFYGLYNEVHFRHHTGDDAPWYNYDELGGGVTWKYHFRPESALIVNSEYVTSDPDYYDYEYNYYYYDPVHNTWYNARGREYDYWTIVAGWEGDLGRVMNGYAKAGYGDMHFTQSNPFSDFSGLIFDAGLGFRASETVKLDLTLNRRPFQSEYNVNNFYTATAGQFQVQQQVSRYLFWSAGYRYQENAYPNAVKPLYDWYWGAPIYEYWATQGQTRKDKIGRAYGEVGVHLTKQISLRANYQYEKRDSNIHWWDYTGDVRPYSYTENRFSFQAQLGW